MFTRFCKHCKEYFKTEKRHSKVCSFCKENNHKKKVMDNLFGGDVLFISVSQ